MYRFCFTLILASAVFLTGCSSEPSIDGTNIDTVRSSWQEMYGAVPESERNAFVEGSGHIVLDSISDVYSDIDPWNRNDMWTSFEYVRITTDIIHRSGERERFYTAIVNGMDGKTKNDIISFTKTREKLRPSGRG